MVHNPWFTPSTCKRHHQNLLETLLCVWWFSRLCFWPFLLLDSLQSSTMQALKQTQVSTTQSQVLVTQKRKVLFHTSTDFGGVSNGLRFGGSMVIRVAKHDGILILVCRFLRLIGVNDCAWQVLFLHLWKALFFFRRTFVKKLT